MKMIECDRCKRIIKLYGTVQVSGERLGWPIDLCHHCAEDLLAWIAISTAKQKRETPDGDSQ